MDTKDEVVIHREITKILELCLKSPGNSTKMYCKSFMGGFKFDRWTKSRVDAVKTALQENYLLVDLPFDTQKDNTWLTFRRFEPQRPPDEWFEHILNQSFESEVEVTTFFVRELLQWLGFGERDFSMEYQVKRQKGSRTEKARVDVLLFDDKGTDHHLPENRLFLVEVKKVEKTPKKTDENLQFAYDEAIDYIDSFRIRAHTFSFMITNGEQIRVYIFGEPELKFSITRAELKERWSGLYLVASKPVLRYLKEKQ